MTVNVHRRNRHLLPTQAGFASQEALEAALREVKEADLGVSVTAIGLFDGIRATCQRLGLTPHTIQYSLGIWGDEDRKPEQPVLDVITMCGHGLIPRALVRKLIRDVQAGACTADEAASTLARLCPCGALNPVRAAHLIEAARQCT